MTVTVDTAFVQQFSDNLIHLVQQKGSRLLPAVRVKNIVGKYAHFDRLGAASAQLKLGRNSDTVYSDPKHSRRRVDLNDYVAAHLLDEEDEIRMLIDPKSDYAMSLANAMGRTLDDIIIDAYTGNAKAIDSSDASSNVAFDTANIVDEDFGTANSELTFAKLREAKRLLMAAEVDPQARLVCVADATDLDNLLGETEVTSSDFVNMKPLVGGAVGHFMGFDFIHSERVNDSSESFKQVMCFDPSAMGVAMGRDIRVRMSEMPDKNYATQVHAAMTAGAVRIEEEKCVIVESYRA